jgi:hypothetical protein
MSVRITKILRPLRHRRLSRRGDIAAILATAGGALLTVGLTAGDALASQGPGIAQGNASPVVQVGMAVIVYGASALVIAAGLIGAARHR